MVTAMMLIYGECLHTLDRNKREHIFDHSTNRSVLILSFNINNIRVFIYS